MKKVKEFFWNVSQDNAVVRGVHDIGIVWWPTVARVHVMCAVGKGSLGHTAMFIAALSLLRGSDV